MKASDAREGGEMCNRFPQKKRERERCVIDKSRKIPRESFFDLFLGKI